MDANRFDSVAKLFAGRRISRRQALTQSGAGLAVGALAAVGLGAAASAQVATPEATAETAHSMLFLQSFRSGSIARKNGAKDRFNLTLEQGLGQTIYFSDRPDRIVGTSPTADFLDGLGFPAENPPNAALVIETAPGQTDIAVVQLFSPVYDVNSHGVTYEVEVLANWQAALEMGFTEAPTDLAALAPGFGSAQLFIDDCPDSEIYCWHGQSFVGTIASSEHDGFCYSWVHAACLPCKPWTEEWLALADWWSRRCNAKFSKCGGQCTPQHLCSVAWNCFA